MKEQPGEATTQIYYRLIALWVICEAFAGGILHGAKIPFTGLFVSSLAVTCIILIGWYIPTRAAIIKATIIVAIFKLMLSPHSPPTAYIAVFFQGLLGQALYTSRRGFAAKAIILAVLALVESAAQRIFVLVILYGKSFWKAVDQFIEKITGASEINSSSAAIATGYIIIHAVVGIVVGVYASRLAKNSFQWKKNHPELIIKEIATEKITASVGKKRKSLKTIFVVCWLLLFGFFVHGLLSPETSLLPGNEVALLLLRSLLIVAGWWLFLQPLASRLLHRWLQKKRADYQTQIAEVLKLLPQTKYIFSRSWQLSQKERSWKRLRFFTKILMINTV